MSTTLQDYYEQNTPLFLYLSGGRSTHSLHRPVWGEDVDVKEEAFAYPYRLVGREVRALPALETPTRVLDLGCGVGGGIFHLLATLDRPLSATGVSLSPTQVEWARSEARARGVAGHCSFRQENFLDLPKLEAVDLAYAIEAFVQAADPEQFFREAAQVVRPGGRLVIVDDVLSDGVSQRELAADEQEWLRTFRDGWQANGLRSVSTIRALAEQHGFVCQSNVDLTPYLQLDRPRDRLIEWGLVPFKSLLWGWSYMQGLIGGYGLQQCLKERIIHYRCLVLERQASS